ncbi:MAG: hypothetical protein SFX74_11950 [Fimbriimonadaceae bacterium]|nr:hypothetical protein [Fimbriimonadaceae bacterium]
MKTFLKRVRQFLAAETVSELRQLRAEVATLREEVRVQSGIIQHGQLGFARRRRLRDFGYSVYSQFGEDGIIQYLVHHVPIENDMFIEFGVEDYRQSNTRYLLETNDWRGIILDMVDDAPRFLEQSGLRGWHTIDYVSSMITAENINTLLSPYAGDIGLLSMDIDGNEYWIWKALEVISPRIVVCEFQPNFGPELPLTVPYQPDFQRTAYHSSNLCYGVGLAALGLLAEAKGYTFVGTTGQHNAFFVRNDVLGSLPPARIADEYRETRYRESRGPNFENTYLTSMTERRRAMRDARLVHVITGETKTVGEWFDV